MKFYLLALLFCFPVFASEYDNTQAFLKYPELFLGPGEYPIPNKWNVYLDPRRKPEILTEDQKEIKLPEIKYFKNKELKGEPYAILDKKGLAVKGKYVCLQQEFLLGRFALFKVNPGPQDRSTVERQCMEVELFPHGWQVLYVIEEIEDGVAKDRIGEQEVYFSTETFKERKIVMPTSAKIKKYLGAKVYKEIKALLNELRVVFLRGNRDEIKKMLLTKHNLSQESKMDIRRLFTEGNQKISIKEKKALLSFTFPNFYDTYSRTFRAFDPMYKFRNSNEEKRLKKRSEAKFFVKNKENISKASIVFKIDKTKQQVELVGFYLKLN